MQTTLEGEARKLQEVQDQPSNGSQLMTSWSIEGDHCETEGNSKIWIIMANTTTKILRNLVGFFFSETGCLYK